MNLEEHPILVLEKLQETFTDIREIIYKNRSIVEEIDSVELGQIKVGAINFDNFHFSVLSAKIDNHKKIKIKFAKCPWNDSSHNLSSSESDKDNVIGNFNIWINLVRRYNNIRFYDPVLNKFQSEHYETLEILDKDAEDKPFDINQQVLLLNYFNIIEDEINKDDSVNKYHDVIIREISAAKVAVVSKSKNQTMYRLSLIWAYVRIGSVKKFKEFVDIFRKELMKKALWEGIERVDDLYNILKGLL